MPNFPSLIRAFINDTTHWTETNPAFVDVEFPQKISKAYLLRSSQIGKCMIWIDESRGAVTESQPLGGGLNRAFYDVFCFARAKSSKEADVEDAEDKAENLRDQVSTIIKANWNTLTDAFIMRPQGTYHLTEYNVDPVYFVKVLTVEVFSEI
jgi:hypothetical protein